MLSFGTTLLGLVLVSAAKDDTQRVVGAAILGAGLNHALSEVAKKG